MAGHITVQLPGGGLHTLGLPLHPSLEKQVAAGVLKPVEAAASPTAVLGGEGGVSRVEAPPPVAVAEPVPPEEPGQPVADALDIPVPAGNASREEWAAYAVTQGLHPDEAAGLKREEIKARIVPADEAGEQ